MTNRDSANRGELLPLPLHPWQCETAMCPQLFSPDQMQAYARANVDRALAESRAEVERQKARAERLARIGGLLANAAYNLAQGVELTDTQRASLDETRKAWDAALNLEPEA